MRVDIRDLVLGTMTIVFIILVCRAYYLSNAYADPLYQSVAEHRRCLLAHKGLRNYSTTFNHGLQTAIKECYMFGAIPVSVANKVEIRKALPLKSKRDDCIFVTLGINQDIRLEEAVKATQPNCKFFGADPIAEGNKKRYKKVGKFFNYAVSSTYLIKPLMFSHGGFSEVKQIKRKPLYDFLRLDVKETLIDYMFVDIDETEYDLLEMLQANMAHSNGFAFCQIGLKLHNTVDIMKQKKFYDFVVRLIRESGYTLVFDDQVAEPGFYHRLFFYNHRETQCRKKFLPL